MTEIMFLNDVIQKHKATGAKMSMIMVRSEIKRIIFFKSHHTAVSGQMWSLFHFYHTFINLKRFRNNKVHQSTRWLGNSGYTV